MTQTTPFPILGDPSEKPVVLRQRFRADGRSLRAQAADLRRRADDLEAAADRAETLLLRLEADPDFLDVIVERYARRWVETRSTFAATRDWTLSQIVRYLVAADEAQRRADGTIAGDRTTAEWHASWAVRGNSSRPGCDCVPCRDEAGLR